MTDKNFDDDLEFDEPLDLNPWQLHDPKGLSGRPPAEPSRPAIRKFRAVVVGIVAVNAIGLFLVPHPQEEFFSSVLVTLLPLAFLLVSTRWMVTSVNQVDLPAGGLGKRGWQKMYNKFRVYIVGIALMAALMRFAFDVAAVAQIGASTAWGNIIYWCIGAATLGTNMVMLFRLRKDALKYAQWPKK